MVSPYKATNYSAKNAFQINRSNFAIRLYLVIRWRCGQYFLSSDLDKYDVSMLLAGTKNSQHCNFHNLLICME